MKELENEMPFVFYPSFRKQLRAIKNEKVKLLIYEALADYGVCGIEPDFSDIDPLGTVEALFVPMRQEIDKAKARYIANVENGKKGGAPKGSRNNPNGRRGNQELTQTNPNKPELTKTNLDKDIDKDKDKDIDIEKEKPTNVGKKKTAQRFSPPSVGEVKDFIASHSYNVDAEVFCDFYESKGWRVGSNPMRSWQAALRTWERRNKSESGANREKVARACANGDGLGVGEFIDKATGRRTYGSGKATIPQDAPPRPSERHAWDSATAKWVLL